MKPQQRITSRQFLGTAAATAGGMMMVGARKLSAATDEFPSNDHFWYRPQPAGPYIDSQRDNKAFGHGDEQVLLSEDNGHTWPHRIGFPEERHMPYVSIEGIALDEAGAVWLVDDPAAPEGWRESCLVRLSHVPPLPPPATAPAR